MRNISLRYLIRRNKENWKAAYEVASFFRCTRHKRGSIEKNECIMKTCKKTNENLVTFLYDIDGSNQAILEDYI